MKRIGVYICHCGTNIAGTVDVAKISDEIGAECKDVAVCRHYKYMCSEPGQKLIRDDIKELGLDYVVEASCTPKMHEPTFRNAVSAAGMNQYMFEMVNIREHCSWISGNPDLATRKAKDLIRGGIARVAHHKPLHGTKKPVNPKTLVVGGGIAGITAALKIAKAGYKVYLVEKEEIIGGRMAQFDKTFPTLDCAGCTLTPKTSEVGRHPNIEILTKSQVVGVSGFVGNFKVSVRQQPRYVSLEKCTGCGDCQKVCPIDVSSSFECGMATRHPISRPFPQAIPNTYSILRAGQPPCQNACPAGVNVPGYMNLTGLGKFEEALAVVRENMPFAAMCGRICFHPCEQACKRGQIDKPLSICNTKRFLGDYELAAKTFKHPPLKEPRKEKVAIVGSGPAGLAAAYFLTLKGYPVTVFEKLPVAGGMLAVGIPAYRLPKDIVAAEVKNIQGMGVEIRTGMTFGETFTLETLQSEEYKAAFLAIGLHQSLRLGIPGEDLKGVLPGVTFLRDVAMGKEVSLGRKVIVIGGGNVAIDVALTAKRLGAEHVSMVCLESREEMPAWEHEIETAIEEKINMVNCFGPHRFIENNGAVAGIEFKQCTCVFDESRCFNPQYDENERQTIDADTVIVAIGQKADLAHFAEQNIAITPRGRLEADPDTLQTPIPWVFAGGDVMLGAATFVQAVAHGKRAAESIHNYVAHGNLRVVKPREAPMNEALTPDEAQRAKPISRQAMPQIALEERRQGFKEVNTGFAQEMAQAEGQRCLSCSVCCQCGECARTCGPQAIDLAATERTRELDVGAIVVATGIDIFDARRYPEYGFGRLPDVITNLQFERMCNASGPTKGRVVRPSTGEVPKSVVFIQCVGSRDPVKGNAYCSKVCCMVTAKQLSIYKHHNHDGQAYVFYIDNRTGGKGYEEFLRRGIEQEKAQYIRGRVAKVYEEGGRLVVRGENSLAGGLVEIEADLVVLATGLVAQGNHMDVARALNLSTDKDGFFIELHPKLGPVETSLAGIYLAGAAQGPKDIPESVAQGGGAAAEVLALFGQGEVEVEPTVAAVSTRLCTGCKTCLGLCAYSAISFDETSKTAAVNEALCQGCGTCAAACPVAAIHVQHYTPDQLFAQIEGILA
jgi:heterodisulfide reductase subunit A2